MPEVVKDFQRRIDEADALLVATPEYNYSMSGVLKNAIDWASRPSPVRPAQPFDGKPIAMMGASAGMMGSARAQYHLRQSCVFLNMLPLNKPEVFVAAAQTKFDAEGRLTDERARTQIRQLLEALVGWARRVRAK